MTMMTEMALETSVSYRQLTRLIAPEDFIEFARCESSRPFITMSVRLRHWSLS